MNVATLATELKTEPRILRRFLRTTRENVGSGSRYVFKEEEEASRAQRGAPSVAEQLRRMRTNPRARLEAQRAAQARVQRLEERLLAAGLHISQYQRAS
jgi:hypothetical protein